MCSLTYSRINWSEMQQKSDGETSFDGRGREQKWLLDMNSLKTIGSS